MTHLQKGNLILIGLVSIFALGLVVGIVCLIRDARSHKDRQESIQLVSVSAIGLGVLLLAFWYFY